MYVLAIDPGVTTGMAMWWEEEGIERGAHACQVGPKSGYERAGSKRDYLSVALAINKIERTLKAALEAAAHNKLTELNVVCEEFTITQRTLQGTLERASLIIRDYLYVWCNQRGIPFTLQVVSGAKSISNQNRIKAISPTLWIPGQQHSHDAARHLDLFLSRQDREIAPVYTQRMVKYAESLEVDDA